MKQRLTKFPLLVLALVVTATSASSAFAATIVIQNGDGPGVGFNDATPATPVGGNSGTTRGQQRLIAFQHAASIWGATLNSGPTITVRATWEPLTCDSSSGVLGSSGTQGIYRNFPGAPLSNTWYSAALANSFAGTDLDPANAEIRARFNINIGSAGCMESRQWYLGLDTNHAPNINLVTVLLHEFSHGLGFQTFTDRTTGVQMQGFPSVYDRFLFDNTTGKTWAQMNDGERVASAVNTGNLVWNGPQVTAAAPGVLTTGADANGRPMLYTPNPVQSGSSVAHWDRNASPNQLMEPTISTTLSHNVRPPFDLTTPLFSDIGWSLSLAAPSPTPTPTPTPTPNIIQLSAGNYTVSETVGSAQLTVTRTSTSAAASVDYATSDNAGLNACNAVNGNASSRCDYATSVGRVSFAVGEASRSIMIPIVNDSYAEGTETFTVTLSNVVGATLGTASSTTTIQDNDSVNGANPIDEPGFFIRQHYIDFLGRDADPGGLQGWLNVLNNCGITIQQPCDRIEVSAGFFRSNEFQQRGYFIYRFYSAVGRIPVYPEFMPDFAKVSGFLNDQQLEANKVAFVDEFMARSDFQNRYGAVTDPTAYVDALLQTVGLPNHSGRGVWIAGLTNQTMTRGQVLRSLVESGEVYNKYYNEAFVIMQYFGYLRRTADLSYLNWIQTMNQTGGDYRIMISGFLNSAEYRQRFGP